MYLIAAKAISPQATYDQAFEQGAVTFYTEDYLKAIEPNYLDFIPAGLLRRMGKAVRMGIGAGIPLLEQHPQISGIILATANGGLEDCIKFLNQIVEYEEGVLTPTNFVQSTPNAVAGQLAIMGQKMGYNSTHTNGALAFDNALMDAKLVLKESSERMELLLGAIEEISSYNYNIDDLNGLFKKEKVATSELIQSTTPGSICGEGATMFVVSNQPEGALAEVVGQAQITYPTKEELIETVYDLLKSHNLSLEDIDLLITGNSGDVTSDHWYTELKKSLFRSTPAITFKQYTGDYRTANAFGCYLSCKLFHHDIADIQLAKRPKLTLIYNHFIGVRHSFILLGAVEK